MQQKESVNNKIVCEDGFCQLVNVEKRKRKKVWFDAIADTGEIKK